MAETGILSLLHVQAVVSVLLAVTLAVPQYSSSSSNQYASSGSSSGSYEVSRDQWAALNPYRQDSSAYPGEDFAEIQKQWMRFLEYLPWLKVFCVIFYEWALKYSYNVWLNNHRARRAILVTQGRTDCRAEMVLPDRRALKESPAFRLDPGLKDRQEGPEKTVPQVHIRLRHSLYFLLLLLQHQNPNNVQSIGSATKLLFSIQQPIYGWLKTIKMGRQA